MEVYGLSPCLAEGARLDCLCFGLFQAPVLATFDLSQLFNFQLHGLIGAATQTLKLHSSVLIGRLITGSYHLDNTAE